MTRAVGLLAIDRRIDAEVLDARGGLAVTTGGHRVAGTLKDIPQLFVEGAQLAIALQVGGDRFEAVCRVLDDAVVVTPGSRIQLEVLKALPADISGIEAFDLVPGSAMDRAPVERVPMDLAPVPPPMCIEDTPVEDDEPTGVVGTLKEMPVYEIVQALAQGAKDAIVEVRPKGSPGGTIGMERGHVVYARTDAHTGEPAFFELFSARRGAFRIRYGRHVDERNIARDTTFLLLEGARILDESENAQLTPPTGTPAALPPVLEADEAGVTLIDPPGFAPAPAQLDPFEGRPLFSGFFDEAGVRTPPPLPETRRFTSLALAEIAEIAELDDVDSIDSDRTTRERK